MKNTLFTASGGFISAALVICLLFFSSCSEEPGRFDYFKEDEFIKTIIHNHDTIPFYELSVKADIPGPDAEKNWNILEFDSHNRFIGIHRQKLAALENLYIPVKSDSDYYISFSYISAEGGKTSSPFIRLEGHPSDNQLMENVYVTLDEPDQVIAFNGLPDEIRSPETGHPYEFVSSYSDVFFFRLFSPGYYEFRSSPDSSYYQNCNVFVSPVKSVHTDRTDMDWYFTQFRTTTTSNCGPTVVSMGIAWAKGEIFPVQEVREAVGWQGSGAVSFEEMQEVLASKGIKSEIVDYENPQQIFRLIDHDNLVGISYNMAGVSLQKDPGNNMFDQYYVDHGGHYLAVKGYTFDEKYFIIYDPIPSDWTENRERYSDGISMYGRNRYYLVDELVKSFIRQQILIIYRDNSD